MGCGACGSRALVPGVAERAFAKLWFPMRSGARVGGVGGFRASVEQQVCVCVYVCQCVITHAQLID